MVSDAAAALDYDVAADVLDLLRVELPPDDDALDDVWPEGDLGILADLGLPADELEVLASPGRAVPGRAARGHRPALRVRRRARRGRRRLVRLSTGRARLVITRRRGPRPSCTRVAAAAPRTGDVPSAPSSSTPPASSWPPPRTPARPSATPRRTPRCSRCGPPRAVRGEWRLDGCTLAVTVEPCTMCAGAIVLSRVARVVFGAWEPRTGAAGSLWDVLRDRRQNHRPEVSLGCSRPSARP